MSTMDSETMVAVEQCDACLVAEGESVTLAECPIGLFMCEGELCLKTEYGNNEGRIDAYIVSSGEFFWGSAPQSIANQRRQRVVPVGVHGVAARPTPSSAGGELRERALALVNPVVLVGDFDDDEDEMDETYPPPTRWAANEAVRILLDQIDALTEEIEIWKSVFPDIAPESVQPDRSKLEAQIDTLTARVGALEGAFRKAEYALRDYACHGGDATPCMRTNDQCRTECGKLAGDTLLEVEAILAEPIAGGGV